MTKKNTVSYTVKKTAVRLNMRRKKQKPPSSRSRVCDLVEPGGIEPPTSTLPVLKIYTI